MKITVKKLVTIIVSAVIMAVLLVGLIIGDVMCARYSNTITMYLCGTGLDDDSEQTQAARESGNALAATVEAEGAVLLKNNGVLPLAVKKVNVFGYAGCDAGFIPQGTGSGTGSRNDLVTFMEGLKSAGIEYNNVLAEAYNDLTQTNEWKRVESGNFVFEASSEDTYKQYYGVMEADESFYNDERLTQARNYSDTAIVVIGRLMGEGNDYSHKQYVRNADNDESRKLQAISQREEYMLRQIRKKFDKVIVVLNTTNPMEMGFIDEKDYDGTRDNVDAALFMGTPGTRGTIGLAKLLTGEITPSGHVTDTWAYDLSTAASYANSGREGVGTYTDISGDTTFSTRINKYSDYTEDIYVGYKWYETADAEGFWDSSAAKLTWNLARGYDQVVQFPFGYGLSYTTFKWTVVGVTSNGEAVSDGAVLAKDGKIDIELLVENTGTVKGKDVVQLYYTPPYTKGGIEKSAVNLGAFAKTAELEPGKSEQLTISLPVEDMKSYDCYDKNNNGFMGYELEGGEYVLTLRTDAHTLADVSAGRNTFRFTVPESGYKYETDTATGNKVENRFTTFTNPTSGASSTIAELAVPKAHSVDGNDEPVKINYMTRNDFISTFPYQKTENRLAGTIKDDALYVRPTPVDMAGATAPPLGSTTTWTIQDVMGLPYEDEKWDQLVGQLDIDTMALLIASGGFGTMAIDSIGKPRTTDTDGPAGYNNTVTGNGGLKAVCYPSDTVIGATWDWYMAYQVGAAIGIEGRALGISGLYGPGANLHRSVTGGRNFEYYSEDARLSGIMCAYEVYGAKEQGVTAYVKHIAVNDSDSGRNGAFKWLTEQNLRENYLLPFEYIVKVGKGNAFMSSVDRIGSTRASSSYAMLTSVLRNEWGFRGTVITDFYQSATATPSKTSDCIHDVDECVRAGNSQILHSDGKVSMFDDTKSVTSQRAIFNSAKDILYSYVDTVNFAATSQGLDKDSVIGNSVEPFRWWIILVVGINVVVVGIIGVWLWLLFKKPRKAKQKSND